MFAVRLPRKKPRESGASSRFGVCQDSLGPGEIGELSSPPLTLAVFRLAEIHSKEPRPSQVGATVTSIGRATRQGNSL